MNRSQLEHIIRASSAITLEDEFIVVGSQSLLGAHPDAPAELRRSMDLDLYPANKPVASNLIDGAIGEGSLFHQTFGYYAHGVGPETAVLPSGWETRLVRVCNENTLGATAWCLDSTDLTASKLAAGRPQDREFVRRLFRHGMIDRATLVQRIHCLPLPESERNRILQTLAALREGIEES